MPCSRSSTSKNSSGSTRRMGREMSTGPVPVMMKSAWILRAQASVRAVS